MNLQKWLRVSFFNLFIVAVAGVVLRYKILFPLPWVDQKNLLHGHSHFAFSGWMAQVLMTLIISKLPMDTPPTVFRRYGPVLWLNLVCAWGMLLSFPVQGYGLVSIIFSNGAIAAAIWFGVLLFSDTRQQCKTNIAYKWFRAGAALNVLSAAGAFSLAYMMATKHMQPDRYLASVYFFLHFQYNGWFSFVVLGLLSLVFQKIGVPDSYNLSIYRCFAYAIIPAYFLSVLWYKLPVVLYALAVTAVMAQFGGWALVIAALWRKRSAISGKFPGALSAVLTLSMVAFSIKIVLQGLSVLPVVSKLAFGFRPIVIGYLHLVLLGFITLFLVAYSRRMLLPAPGRVGIVGTWLFVAGVIVNECVLMIQGIGDLFYLAVPGMNEVLLGAALMLASGLLLFFIAINERHDSRNFIS